MEAGVSRDGWIAYELPDDIERDELVVSYTGGDLLGEWTVRWAVDPEEAGLSR